MDNFYQNEKTARNNLVELLQQLDDFNTQNPNTMIIQFFFQGKSNELIKLFAKASPQEKSKAREILSRLDITNSSRYKDELK